MRHWRPACAAGFFMNGYSIVPIQDSGLGRPASGEVTERLVIVVTLLVKSALA